MTREENILKRIKSIILEKEPDARIILYGSRARGNPHPESDWDLLILLDKEIITFEIEKNISYSLYDLELEVGEVITPMIYSKKDWYSKYKVTPFYFNVMKEGKPL
jgi:predicted nucleotidyltransferase